MQGLVRAYPKMASKTEKGKVKRQILNAYFIMFNTGNTGRRVSILIDIGLN